MNGHPSCASLARRTPAAIALLAIAVITLYWPSLDHNYVNYDDPLYLNMNPGVMKGFTREGLHDMWFTYSYGNWQPVTLMAHALDIKLFGFNAGAHHAVSFLLHAVNSMLVFLFLRKWTGHAEASFIAAALWALHPLNVDAVAWISQRKTLLATLFGLLAAMNYLAFHDRPTPLRAAATTLFLMVAIMSKGVIVILPLVLWLLIDQPWMGFASQSPRKYRWLGPVLVALGIAFGLNVMVGQESSSSIVSVERFPLGARIGYAFDNYLHYLVKLFAPFGLAIQYATPEAPLPWWRYTGVVLLISGISLFALLGWKRRPWFAMGWFWFALNLAPLSGILATGTAIKTDRFAYIPSIGICLLAGFVLARWHARYPRTGLITLTLMGLLFARTRDQLASWRNSESVYLHALEVTAPSALVHNNLAAYYINGNEMDKAAVHLVEALRLLSDDEHSWANLEIVLMSPSGQRALDFHLKEIAATKPDDPYYRLVRFMIALVQIRKQDARRLLDEIMTDTTTDTRIHQRAEAFLAEYESRYGQLFQAGEQDPASITVAPP